MNDLSDRIKEFKKQHPNISDEKIAQGLAEFEEQVKIVDDCINEIDRAVHNAYKIGQNLKFAPRTLRGFVSRKDFKSCFKNSTGHNFDNA